MRVTADDATVTVDFRADASAGRQCGGCTLCCKLVPVPVLRKAAGTRCRHQRHGKGCAIYHRRPEPCMTWSCRWLADPEGTKQIARPDRGHYVIDIEYDEIRITHNITGEARVYEAAQVWMDPAFPAARHDPALRAYMLRVAQPPLRMATMLRWEGRRATVVFAPPLSEDRQWHEVETTTAEDFGRWSRLHPDDRPPD